MAQLKISLAKAYSQLVALAVATLTHTQTRKRRGSDRSEQVYQFWTSAKHETGLPVWFSPWPELWTKLWSSSAKFRTEPQYPYWFRMVPVPTDHIFNKGHNKKIQFSALFRHVFCEQKISLKLSSQIAVELNNVFVSLCHASCHNVMLHFKV